MSGADGSVQEFQASYRSFLGAGICQHNSAPASIESSTAAGTEGFAEKCRFSHSVSDQRCRKVADSVERRLAVEKGRRRSVDVVVTVVHDGVVRDVAESVRAHFRRVLERVRRDLDALLHVRPLPRGLGREKVDRVAPERTSCGLYIDRKTRSDGRFEVEKTSTAERISSAL